MALDHGVGDIELALTIELSVNIVTVIFEHLLLSTCWLSSIVGNKKELFKQKHFLYVNHVFGVHRILILIVNQFLNLRFVTVAKYGDANAFCKNSQIILKLQKTFDC
jgi:hypothetical protein